jgi:hypothetical protein
MHDVRSTRSAEPQGAGLGGRAEKVKSSDVVYEVVV